MRDIKEKPQKPKIKGNAFKERRPMAKGNAAGRMGRLMKDHYLRERDKGRQEKKPNAVTAAEEQVEQAAEEAVSPVPQRPKGLSRCGRPYRSSVRRQSRPRRTDRARGMGTAHTMRQRSLLPHRSMDSRSLRLNSASRPSPANG